ncbi:EntF family bacteriocin induction factor [Latilactobacillus sakei]
MINLTNKQLKLIIGGTNRNYGKPNKDIGTCIWSGFRHC